MNQSIKHIEGNYPCTGCGQCCRILSFALEVRDTLKPGDRFYQEYVEFPYHAINGACSELLPDSTCGVYDHRPNLCNSNFIYEKYFANEETRQQHFEKAADGCNQLVVAYELGEDYLVKV